MHAINQKSRGPFFAEHEICIVVVAFYEVHLEYLFRRGQIHMQIWIGEVKHVGYVCPQLFRHNNFA